MLSFLVTRLIADILNKFMAYSEIGKKMKRIRIIPCKEGEKGVPCSRRLEGAVLKLFPQTQSDSHVVLRLHTLVASRGTS